MCEIVNSTRDDRTRDKAYDLLIVFFWREKDRFQRMPPRERILLFFDSHFLSLQSQLIMVWSYVVYKCMVDECLRTEEENQYSITQREKKKAYLRLLK